MSRATKDTEGWVYGEPQDVREILKTTLFALVEYGAANPDIANDALRIVALNYLDDIFEKLEAIVAQEVLRGRQELAEEITSKLDKSYEESGKGSRTQYSKQFETKGESYSRSQGFKSGMLIAKKHVGVALQALTRTPPKETE